MIVLLAVVFTGCVPDEEGVSSNSKKYIGIAFNANDTDGYMFGFRQGVTEKPELFEFKNNSWSVIATGNNSYNSNLYHDLIIITNNNSFEGYVDGNLEIVLNNITTNNNKTGIMTENANLIVDSFAVYNNTRKNKRILTNYSFINNTPKTFEFTLNTSNLSLGPSTLYFQSENVDYKSLAYGVWILNKTNIEQTSNLEEICQSNNDSLSWIQDIPDTIKKSKEPTFTIQEDSSNQCEEVPFCRTLDIKVTYKKYAIEQEAGETRRRDGDCVTISWARTVSFGYVGKTTWPSWIITCPYYSTASGFPWARYSGEPRTAAQCGTTIHTETYCGGEYEECIYVGGGSELLSSSDDSVYQDGNCMRIKKTSNIRTKTVPMQVCLLPGEYTSLNFCGGESNIISMNIQDSGDSFLNTYWQNTGGSSTSNSCGDIIIGDTTRPPDLDNLNLPTWGSDPVLSHDLKSYSMGTSQRLAVDSTTISPQKDCYAPGEQITICKERYIEEFDYGWSCFEDCVENQLQTDMMKCNYDCTFSSGTGSCDIGNVCCPTSKSQEAVETCKYYCEGTYATTPPKFTRIVPVFINENIHLAGPSSSRPLTTGAWGDTYGSLYGSGTACTTITMPNTPGPFDLNEPSSSCVINSGYQSCISAFDGNTCSKYKCLTDTFGSPTSASAGYQPNLVQQLQTCTQDDTEESTEDDPQDPTDDPEDPPKPPKPPYIPKGYCGDGRIGGSETCDGTNLGGFSCSTFGYDSGDLTCTDTCDLNISNCNGHTTGTCGDNGIDTGEICDGTDLAGLTCGDFGYDFGSLICIDCNEIDTFGCYNKPIGCPNGEIDPGETCDGTNLGENDCLTLGYSGGTLSCYSNCQLNTRDCISAEVGCNNNGVLEYLNNEECDTNDFGRQTCLDFDNFDGGNLLCDSNCKINVSECTGPNPPSCDNDGIIDSGESCDTLELNGKTCTNFGYYGGELKCDNECNFDISECNYCGNTFVETGEDCDTDIGRFTCEKLGYLRGTLSCNSECKFDTSSCEASDPDEMCNNDNIKDANELCDGTDLSRQTCESFYFGGGELSCNNDCTFNTSKCYSCGDQIVNPGETCDSNNFNGLKCNDFDNFLDQGSLICNDDCSINTSYCVKPIQYCGNNRIDAGESCDGTALRSLACTDFGYSGGTLICQEQGSLDPCNFDFDGCTGNIVGSCGNDIIEQDEECDNLNLNGFDCSTFGFNAGSLSCTDDCKFDSDGCRHRFKPNLALQLNQTSIYTYVGNSTQIKATLSNIRLGGNYNISIERWEDAARTVPLITPTFVKIPTNVSVENDSSVDFLINITDPIIESQIKNWGFLIVKANNSVNYTEAKFSLTVDINSSGFSKIVNYSRLVSEDIEILAQNETIPTKLFSVLSRNQFNKRKSIYFNKYDRKIASLTGHFEIGDMDLYNVSMDSSPNGDRVYIDVSNVNLDNSNINSLHTLYLPKRSPSEGVYICPNATNLTGVTETCNNVVYFDNCEISAGIKKSICGNNVRIKLIDDVYEITNLACSGAGSVGPNSSLFIWSETDTNVLHGNQIKYINDNVKFFANYTNLTGNSITGANCNIIFNDTSWLSMTYNTTGFYEYNRNFLDIGIYEWNVSCSNAIYAPSNLSWTVTISEENIFKGIIPMNSGIPFYTITQNPMPPSNLSCLTRMIAGEECNQTWIVNATGDIDSTWIFYTEYNSTLNGYSKSSDINITILDEPDVDSPTIILINPQNNSINSTDNNIIFSFNASDNINIGSCSIYINNIINYTDSSIVNNAITSHNEAFTNGDYSWFVNCTDTSGNSNISETWYFTVDIDLEVPKIELISPTNGTVNQTDNTIDLIWNATDNVDVATCSLYVNDTLNYTGSSVTNGAFTDYQETFTNGDYSWFVNCTDTSGNQNMSDTWMFTVNVTPPDTKKPYITLISPPNTNVNTTNNTITLTWNVSDNVDVDNCSLYINNTLNYTDSSITNNAITSHTENFNNGDYEWFVNCTDTSGNQNMSDTWMFTVGVTSVTLTPPNLTTSLAPNREDVILNWTTITGADGYYIWYSDNVSEMINVNISLPANITILGDTNNSWIDTLANQSDKKYYRIAAYYNTDVNLSTDIIGKYDISVKPSNDMISLPLISEQSIDSVFGPVNDMAMIYTYNATADDWPYSIYNEVTGWDYSLGFENLDSKSSYWMFNFNQTYNITNVGHVNTSSQNVTLSAGSNTFGINLLEPRPFADIFGPANDGDTIYANINNEWVYNYYNADIGQWVNNFGFNTCEPGMGYMANIRVGTYNFNYTCCS